MALPNTDIDHDRASLSRTNRRKVLYIVAVCILIVIVTLYSVVADATGITPSEIYQSIVNYILPGTYEISDTKQYIALHVYVPRVLMALIIGAILAIGGCITQTILKNPLATPYTLGVSSSASFGAGLVIIAGIGTAASTGTLMLFAFIFSMIPAFVILAVASKRYVMPTTLILIGVAISYLFSAANTLMQYFGDAEAVKEAIFWTVGDLNKSLITQPKYMLLVLVFGVIMSYILMKDINIMRMGDDTAKSLGVNVRLVRVASVILACFITAAAVSFVGAIGFVCLLGPQISRAVVGGDLKYLLPASAVTGSLLLLLADLVAKTIVTPIILPVGAITAVIGAPVMIYLLIRNRNTVVS